MDLLDFEPAPSESISPDKEPDNLLDFEL